ncbi:hypothetical protein LR48_Vigan08g047500 [Vigna angularis]|uniref:Uncharacterized protein n=1 Tax=Phaseolus angularis TaxID=3914 RepID=A0A0L9V3M9_PHAAN|nr:hypothetical protein LR48_Vigan08g047500 [Vigna angularis]
MTREGSERRDKGKEVARPKKRQRQTPKYVLRVPATLPITVYLSSSSVGPSPTPVVHPPPTPIVHPPPTPVVHPLPTPAANILPPPVIVTLTPPPVIITPIAPPDPTSIPSSSFIPSSETATPSADLDLAGDGVDPPLHGRPWIEPYGKGGGPLLVGRAHLELFTCSLEFSRVFLNSETEEFTCEEPHEAWASCPRLEPRKIDVHHPGALLGRPGGDPRSLGVHLKAQALHEDRPLPGRPKWGTRASRVTNPTQFLLCFDSFGSGPGSTLFQLYLKDPGTLGLISLVGATQQHIVRLSKGGYGGGSLLFYS